MIAYTVMLSITLVKCKIQITALGIDHSFIVVEDFFQYHADSLSLTFFPDYKESCRVVFDALRKNNRHMPLSA